LVVVLPVVVLLGGLLPHPIAGRQTASRRSRRPVIRTLNWPRRRERAAKNISSPARPRVLVAIQGEPRHEVMAKPLAAVREVVVMVNVCVTCVPLMGKGAGTLQVMPVGTGDVGGVQVRVIVVEAPEGEAKVRLIAAGEPAGTVFMVVVLPVGSPIEKSRAWPVPVRVAVRMAAALPVVVTVRVPLRVPKVVGVKVMATVQELLAGMLVPQVLVWV